MKLVFVSSNPNKVAEIKQMLPKSIDLIGLEDVEPGADIEETAKTLQGNADIKASYIWDKYKLNSFSDDTGLEVFALNNEPGVYSARYAGTPSNSENNMNKLLANLNENKNREAQFRTSICLIIDGEKTFFEGKVTGKITEEKRGDQGFGYDPIFIPDGHSKSFAQMSSDEKNSLSHRKRAVSKLVDFLKERYG